MVFGVNGNNNVNLSSIYPTKNLVKLVKAGMNGVKPIELVQNNEMAQIDRTDLEKLSKTDAATIEYKTIADNTNATLAAIGCNYRVTPRQVASVEAGLNETTIPALALAGDNATSARIANPNGPFAELFA